MVGSKARAQSFNEGGADATKGAEDYRDVTGY